jgi:hypothetical protein
VKEDEMGIVCSTYGEKRIVYRILVGKPEGERDHYEDLDVGGRIILKWVYERWNGMVYIGLMLFRIGTSGGLL